MREDEKDKIYPYMKFNIKVDLVKKYTVDEYKIHIKNLDKSWTIEESDYLWELCERFDLRFIIVFDRYDDKYQRTEEDLKFRYYDVAKKLL